MNANEVPLIGEEGAAAAAVEISFLKTLHSLLGLDFVNNISPLRFLLRVERERGGDALTRWSRDRMIDGVDDLLINKRRKRRRDDISI